MANTASKAGIVGLLGILLAFGGYMVLNDQEQAAAYACNATGQFGVFYGGLSLTGKTAYPYNDTKIGSKLCSTGWVKINFPPGMPLPPPVEPQPPTPPISSPDPIVPREQYSCSTTRCVKVGY